MLRLDGIGERKGCENRRDWETATVGERHFKDVLNFEMFGILGSLAEMSRDFFTKPTSSVPVWIT